ncbi:MAG TPA: DUF4129 domain-containing protein [Pirellulales bacterium]|nr:DUF4129 domain-containing protein [Pirellulales bacterium]
MVTSRQLFGATLLAVLGVALAPPPLSTAADEADGVEQGRQALDRERFPWYDKQADAPRPVHVDVPWNITTSNRKSNFPSWNLGGIGIGEWLAILVLTAALVALVWLLMRAYLNREETVVTVDSARVRQAAVDDAARIEALPFRIRRRDIDLLDEARRLYEAGKYGEAMVYLFSYQLVEMDRHQVIRLAKGKTNRQYLRDLRRQPSLREIIERSMVAFEEVFFGGHVLDRARFEAVWHQLGQFTSFVTQQARP